MPKNAVCAEIGVHTGDFSQKIIDITQPKKIYLIDPWKFQPDKNKHHNMKARSELEMDLRYEKVKKRFPEAIICRDKSENILPNIETLDWVYIDGDHRYEYVMKDLEMSLKKVKSYIMGDDYYNGMWYQGSVKKAVNDFVKKHSLPLVTQNGQFLISL